MKADKVQKTITWLLVIALGLVATRKGEELG